MVAVKDVPAGMPFNTAWNEGRLAMSDIPMTLRPPTAVTDANTLAGLIATAPLAQGQLVVQESFASATKNDRVGPPTFATQLADGMVAVSFKATAEQAVSDLIRPGDHVNFLVQVPNASVLGLPDSGGAAMVHVFQDLTIIAIGDVQMPAQDAKEAPKNPGTGLYTVAVSPSDSARLLLFAHEYDVYLTLVGPKTAPSDIPPIADGNGLSVVPTTLPTATP
jgi:Flp pilus assembly protein CpaB